MIQPIQLRGLTVGAGVPKVCVPITGVSAQQIEEQARQICEEAPDLVEWRADYYENIEDLQKTREVLSCLRDILEDIPLLFTFRGTAEGGMREMTMQDYVALNVMAAESGLADAVDVEIFQRTDGVAPLLAAIRKAGRIAVGSSHHFTRTPAKEEILLLLQQMQEAGADILKIAVMPRDQRDLLTLLDATWEAAQRSERPLITMAMGSVGVLSRISGEIFGSAVTFGTVGQASAPGQLPLQELRRLLSMLHGSIDPVERI